MHVPGYSTENENGLALQVIQFFYAKFFQFNPVIIDNKITNWSEISVNLSLYLLQLKV